MSESDMHKGPRPCYRDEHLVYILFLLRRSGRLSRRSISERIGIGEGSVRSALAHLTETGLLSTTKRGVSLSESGRRFLDGLGVNVVPLGTVGAGHVTAVAAVVKGAADEVGDGLPPIFAAIRAGADDVSVYRMDGGMVQVCGYSPDFGDAMERCRISGTADGDAVVICGSEDEAQANLAAVAAGIGFRRAALRSCT